ncbi:sodium bile acid symporter family protein [Zymoseptoria brevis]|uniref:Sodium bile acid symporter family protein n=1 Tax=Zymoseptoria brevis TaxID=1047168 RepID=A0A0F4GCI3_9PEZI|nr:sodium bile acid symporter family protein [Zymoseptoria brevis]
MRPPEPAAAVTFNKVSKDYSISGDIKDGIGVQSKRDEATYCHTSTSTSSSPNPAGATPNKFALPPLKTWPSHILHNVLSQWFLITMLLLILFASQVQVPSSQQATKSVIVSYLLVSIIFFITSCTLSTTVLMQNAGRWKTHLWVQGNCFLTCSALMFGLVSATAAGSGKDGWMDGGLLIGMAFMGCLPTTLASNVVMTGQAGGNVALTVVEVVVGNLIGVFLSPGLVLLYTGVDTWYNGVLSTGSLDDIGAVFRRVLMQLGLSIYVPLAVGQVVRWFFETQCDLVFKKYKLGKLGAFCILVVQWSTFDQAFRSGAFETIKGSNMAFIVLILMVMFWVYFGIALGGSWAWYGRKDIVSITYCVAAKGLAFGVPLSNAMFRGIGLDLSSKLQIPIVIYAAIQMAFGSILVVFFKKWNTNAERNAGR